MRRITKVNALILIFVLITELLTPTLAFALTAGPTAPEATSFEPVDTTDMVNPLTGGFTYNMPLLEVPGPEGSYPLSLAYHAGIQPNEEASWAGLGWSLNPGAITRNVNGYADDYSDVQASTRSYWAGGSRSTFGITVGIGGVMLGLSFAEDTYQGFGVGASVGYGYQVPGTNIVIGGNIGINPFGGEYAGVNAGLSTLKSGEAGYGVSIGVGISTNFKSISGGVNVSLVESSGTDSKGNSTGSNSLLGASMSSSSSKPNFSLGGASVSVYNANAGKIQTRSSGFGFSIPLGIVSLGVSFNHTKYWSDETASTFTNGSLYCPQQITDQSYLTGRTYDIYRLTDAKNYNIVDYPDPDQLQGGTFPDFDYYTVMAQGLGGNIRPYIYQSGLYSQNQTSIVQTTGASLIGMSPTPGIQFRFVNDFSNTYTQAPLNIPGVQFNFDSPVYGHNDANYGYNASTNQLAGSKHITWYTNDQINNFTAKNNGFIDTKSAGFIRMGNPGEVANTKGGSQIGGFVITNESGVSYHYALPVYEKNEYTYTATQDDRRYTDETKNEPYAYTWFLTAITGPDFVDKNQDGLADDGDWGYWVTFDYGKWNNNYNWRNPEQGAHAEVDRNYKSYSQGVKEIYYLDAIKTRTHTALFVKETRNDAKSISATGSGFDNTSAWSLGLSYILLLQNDQFTSSLATIRSSTSSRGPTGNAANYIIENVIQTTNIANLSENLNQKCLRKVLFSHDYSLTPGVTNSFPAGSSSNSTNLGKYTLLSVDLQGKGGTSMTPPIQFQYDLDPTDLANKDNIDLTSTPVNLTGNIHTYTLNKFSVGDIITFTVNSIKYYCTLLSTIDGQNFNVLYLNAAPIVAVTNLSAFHTKNPPYNSDAYDVWQIYKSDYVPVSNNENLSRETSQVSNKNTDVWSLRSIQTSLGTNFKMNYEGQTYSRSVFNKNKAMLVNSGTINSNNTLTLNLFNPQNLDLTTFYKVGNKFSGVFLFQQDVNYYPPNFDPINLLVNTPLSTDNYKPSIITGMSGNTITVSVDPAMLTYLNNPVTGINFQHTLAISFKTGNVNGLTTTNNYGGGIRVKDLIVDDLNGNVRKTSYNYNMPGILTSSGVTSYEPVGLDVDNIQPYLTVNGVENVAVEKVYRKYLYQDINNLLTLSREAPSPGVMYEYVTVADSDIVANNISVPVEGQTTYQFRVFNVGMIGIHQYQYDQSSTQYSKNLSLKDYTSQIGNLIRTINYDNHGNKIKEQINHYLNDDIVNKPFEYQVDNYDSRLSNYGNQGFIQERYSDGRTFINGNSSIYELTMSGRDEIPIIQTGTTSIDFKNGVTINQQNLGFDFYSGVITKTLSTDSYGNQFVNEVIPAYREYPAMGLKTASISNANMLVQDASNYTYSVDANQNKIGVVTASVQTWGNDVPVFDQDGNGTTIGQAAIWRMKANYEWRSNGSSPNNVTPYNSFVDYYYQPGTAHAGSGNPAWQLTSQITRYNVYSAALEAVDINNNNTATRMGYNNSKVLITGNLANYNEIAFSGAEDPVSSNGNFSNNISKGGGTVISDSTQAHSGLNSLMIPSNQTGFNYSIPVSAINSSRNYSVSVWVKPTSANFNQASLYYQVGSNATFYPVQSFAKSAAGWYLLEMTVPSGALSAGGNLTVGCKNGSSANLYFDDFRFQPTSSSTTANVYDPTTGELTYIIGNNNLFTRFQYDAIGRLVRTYKEVLGKTKIPLVKGIAYNYAKLIFTSNPHSQTYYSHNCGSGVAQPIVYSAAQYTSTISKEDANAKAQADLDANGQNYANVNGACYVGFSVENYPQAANYTVYFYNTATSMSYSLAIASSGPSSTSIPAGTYNISASPAGDNHYRWSLGDFSSNDSPGFVFENVSITAGGSNTGLIIDYPH